MPGARGRRDGSGAGMPRLADPLATLHDDLAGAGPGSRCASRWGAATRDCFIDPACSRYSRGNVLRVLPEGAHMRRMLLVAVALGITWGPGGAAGQELEHVFVEVLDRAGRPVPDLTPADFALQENNVDLDVVSVRRGTPRPMSIALLVDNGGRVAAPAERDALREGLAAFLRTLPPRHEVSIHTIRGRVRRVLGPTTDRGDLDDAIGRVRVGARARVGLLDSVREVSEPRYEDDEPFPVVVLVLPNGDEDGGDGGGDIDLQMARFAAAGIMAHAVVLEPRSARGGGGEAPVVPGVARDLTRLLRGVYMTLTSRTQLSLGLSRLASRLAAGYERMSMQYRVSYVPSGADGAEIMVGVRRSGVEVRPLPQLQLP